MLDTSVYADQRRWPGAGSYRRPSDFQFKVHLIGVGLPGILRAAVRFWRHSRSTQSTGVIGQFVGQPRAVRQTIAAPRRHPSPPCATAAVHFKLDSASNSFLGPVPQDEVVQRCRDALTPPDPRTSRSTSAKVRPGCSAVTSPGSWVVRSPATKKWTAAAASRLHSRPYNRHGGPQPGQTRLAALDPEAVGKQRGIIIARVSGFA